MTRTIVASIMLALSTGGFAFADTPDAMQPVTYGESALAAADRAENRVTVGTSGETAYIGQEEVTLTPESNVEETEDKKDLSEIRGSMGLN